MKRLFPACVEYVRYTKNLKEILKFSWLYLPYISIIHCYWKYTIENDQLLVRKLKISDLHRFKEWCLIFSSTFLTLPFCVIAAATYFFIFKNKLYFYLLSTTEALGHPCNLWFDLVWFREPGMRINLRKYLLIGLNSVQQALQDDRLK